ncbi:hypothetical protein BC833DRAFT_571947 [Globomyces pollinis-pini]|nr:hypothetical protein BC833DRAFT_571947 [Globomyces pollinis-pini]
MLFETILISILTLTLTAQSHSTNPIIQLTDADIPSLYDNQWAILIYLDHHQLLQDWSDCQSSLNNDTIQFATLHASQTRALSILEVKLLPVVKFIDNGQVFTYRSMMTKKSIEKFLSNPRKLKWHNYLPTSYSYWTKLQLDLYLASIHAEKVVLQYLVKFFKDIPTDIENVKKLFNLVSTNKEL